METGHPQSSILHPRRILVRGTNWLGDAVMTTPALMRLREKFPDAHIVLLTPEKLKDLWLHHPAIDDIIVFTADESVCSSKLQFQSVENSAPGILISRWCCPIPPAPRSKSGWPEFRNASATHVPGGMGS